MNVKVADASAVTAILFDEPEADDVAGTLEDGHFVTPCLLQYELANVCLVKLRRRPAEREAIVRAFELRDRLNVQMREVNVAGMVVIAKERGLTAYDASYPWLARFSRCRVGHAGPPITRGGVRHPLRLLGEGLEQPLTARVV